MYYHISGLEQGLILIFNWRKRDAVRIQEPCII